MGLVGGWQAVRPADDGPWVAGHGLVLTSGNITKDGWADSPYYTAADWAAQRLKRRGMGTNLVAVPCRVERADRTYHAALEVRRWLDRAGVRACGVNVLTLGPHARRSRLLFQKALGPTFRIGIISVAGREYDPTHWWRSSDGVRDVVGEALAYGYARCFFSRTAGTPARPQHLKQLGKKHQLW